MGYEDGNRLFIDGQMVQDLASGTPFSPISVLFPCAYHSSMLSDFRSQRGMASSSCTLPALALELAIFPKEICFILGENGIQKPRSGS